jgi:hypothetical protein
VSRSASALTLGFECRPLLPAISTRNGRLSAKSLLSIMDSQDLQDDFILGILSVDVDTSVFRI